MPPRTPVRIEARGEFRDPRPLTAAVARPGRPADAADVSFCRGTQARARGKALRWPGVTIARFQS